MSGMSTVIERMLSVPDIAMEVFATLDAPGMFLHAARNMGFENVHDFIKEGGNLQAQVVPDEQAQAMAQAGDARMI